MCQAHFYGRSKIILLKTTIGCKKRYHSIRPKNEQKKEDYKTGSYFWRHNGSDKPQPVTNPKILKSFYKYLINKNYKKFPTGCRWGDVLVTGLVLLRTQMGLITSGNEIIF
ncbi:hypothetical protein BpHYR1_018246 [Brachionus plicatilis]|uniref:Uncharacterized protein n=1 Tax=Brachionus plicatilis TaxID=10195 RepID=A0A3M7SRS2_BRAPC|nr:hypothetical protein BpHYR1_018246 [Brachionus plicatilis]